MFNFELGEKVKVTEINFSGIVTSRAEYIDFSPNRYLVESIDSTGRPIEYWYDEGRLELLRGENV